MSQNALGTFASHIQLLPPWSKLPPCTTTNSDTPKENYNINKILKVGRIHSRDVRRMALNPYGQGQQGPGPGTGNAGQGGLREQIQETIIHLDTSSIFSSVSLRFYPESEIFIFRITRVLN